MELQRYFDVSQSADVDTFRSQLITFAQTMGFGFVTACQIVEDPRPTGKAKVVRIGNTPAGFEESSTSVAAGARDPVLKRLKSMSVPFLYDRRMYIDESAADLWEEQAAFGYKTGICVALHLPDHKHFLLGVDRDEPLPQDDERLTRLMADLQLLAVHAQAAGDRLLTPRPVAPHAEIKLTPREREVLLWTMDGKSAGDVAQILGLSEHTVVFHLRNVARKLDASTKHQAVLKALALGLI